MRGIEAALKVLTSDVTGPFASEALRKLADREGMKASDISLASSLVYIVMRRKELWEKIAGRFLTRGEKLPPQVMMSIFVGTGGLLELRRFSGGVLVNGILDTLKRTKSLARYASLVNAVLRKITESGEELMRRYREAKTIEDKAVYSGVPLWTLPAWGRTWTKQELSELFALMNQPSYASLRVAPGKREELLTLLEASGIRAQPSDITDSLRLNESILPAKVPGYSEGLFTVQSEGSILAASLVRKFYEGGKVLDMCSGRGVKSAQILQECEGSNVECWEISERRIKSAEAELSRLGLSERAVLRAGDAVNLTTEGEAPSFVVLDAPCSCSGTWTRKPESKWRLDWQKLDSLSALQKKLLGHAVKVCKPGGYVLYITCSLLKPENENVVAEVLAANPECAEVSNLIDWDSRFCRRGKPYGAYIWPVNSWLDGFYCSLILRRK